MGKVHLNWLRHYWFAGRGPKCVLMMLVDDATNRERLPRCQFQRV